MRVFVNNLTPEHPDPEDESYWDFMADSLNMRRYDDEGTRPNSIDLTMTTQQGARTHTTQVVSSTAKSNPQRVRNQRPRQGVIMRSEHVTINGGVGKISKCGKA